MPETILVGDSGVGKTSLLVQFDQGKFIPGSFSATVGIGFTGLYHFGYIRSPKEKKQDVKVEDCPLVAPA
ncbi:Ras-related protein Rab-26 [Varanus komodoensis]|nr:Ras-related protein Rab-26 [Varanus komodoensis]